MPSPLIRKTTSRWFPLGFIFVTHVNSRCVIFLAPVRGQFDVRRMRIAMWSGPRNISTAMMRSWGNRADTAVIDEPFYAFYLKRTGKAHPGAEEVLSQCETD